MRVRLGQLEFVDLSPEELDELIRRYGGALDADSDNFVGKQPKSSQHGASDARRDSVVLRALVEAGANGVPTTSIGSLLGRKGKAMRGAARQWSARVGLTHDATDDPFEDCRVGTARGIRIKADLQVLAKELLKGGGDR